MSIKNLITRLLLAGWPLTVALATSPPAAHPPHLPKPSNLLPSTQDEPSPEYSGRTFEPSNPGTLEPSNPRTLEPSNPQTFLAPGWNNLGPGLNGDVAAIVVDGADVYVGGSFTDAGGIPEADYLARWDGANWHAVGAGLTGAVRSIAIQGSNIYVGGQFLNAGGNANADRIAYWDGSAWNAIGTGLNGTVWALAINGATLYAGGDFTLAGGVASASYIARWDGKIGRAHV